MIFYFFVIEMSLVTQKYHEPSGIHDVGTKLLSVGPVGLRIEIFHVPAFHWDSSARSLGSFTCIRILVCWYTFLSSCTTQIIALILISTITFLTRIYDTITAYCTVRFCIWEQGIETLQMMEVVRRSNDPALKSAQFDKHPRLEKVTFPRNLVKMSV